MEQTRCRGEGGARAETTSDGEERHPEESGSWAAAPPQSTKGAEEPDERNLLSRLPYVVLRCLLDFLVSSPFPAVSDEVPELLRVRAERDRHRIVHRLGVFVPPGQEEAYALRHSAQARRLSRTRPYHIPATRQAYLRHHVSWCAIGALRLTCSEVKLAVDHALGPDAPSSLMAAANALYAPLDRFLADQFFPSARDLSASSSPPSSSSSTDMGEPRLPLFSDTPEAAQVKAWFRKMADVALGTAQARLHQARLYQVLSYVWSQWRFAPEKLGLELQPPLLKVEYLQREDDYLGQSYALGINACLSVGLPDIPQERSEIWLNVLQAWDHRAHGWDLDVLVTLHTPSDVWRQRLLSSTSAATDDGEGEEQDGDETEAERTQTGGPLRLILLDYVRSRNYVGDPPAVKFDVLRKLWQCLGLDACSSGGGQANAGQRESESESDIRSWKGKEVLTTLLACLGFAWKDDIELMWADCTEEDLHDQEDDYDHRLLQTGKLKRKDWMKMRKQAEQLDDLLAYSPNEAGQAKLLELAVRRIRRFIGQQRLARAASYMTQRAQSGSPWAWPALTRLDGREVAKELRVIYVHTMNLEPGEYSSLSDATVELAWRIPADALHRTSLSSRSSSSQHQQQTEDELLSTRAELVIGVSTKLDNCYTSEHYQEMVTVRLVGHPQLRAKLHDLIARAKTSEHLKREIDSDEVRSDDLEEEGVVLHMKRGDGSRSVMATEAIEFIGHLLGLSLRPENDDTRSTTTQFAESVLAFMYDVARATTWDAEESTFPLHSALFRRWCRDAESLSADDTDDDDDGDEDDDAYDDSDVFAIQSTYKPKFMA